MRFPGLSLWRRDVGAPFAPADALRAYLGGTLNFLEFYLEVRMWDENEK